MTMKRTLAAAAGLMMAGLMLGAGSPPADAPKGPALNFTVQSIDGKDVDLTQYVGKVVMIVNVASKCGNTPQYKGLEAMYEKYKDKGFVILGFPANNFKQQEPGTNAEIMEFCKSTYDVKFPMFSKISVKGDDQAPLYKYLTGLDAKPKGKGDVTWNFEKFLVGRDGNVVARFAPKTQPEDPAVTSAVEQAIAK